MTAFPSVKHCDTSDGDRGWLKGQIFCRRGQADRIVVFPTIHRIFLHGLSVAKRLSASWEHSTQWISIAQYSKVAPRCSGLGAFYFTKFDRVISTFRDRCRRIGMRSRGWWVGFFHCNVVTFPISQNLSRDLSTFWAVSCFTNAVRSSLLFYCAAQHWSSALRPQKTTEWYFVIRKSVCVLLETQFSCFSAFCVYFMITFWYLASSGN